MQSDFQKICPRQRKRVAKNVLMAKKQKQNPQKQQQHQTKTKTTCIKCRTKCTHGKYKLNKKSVANLEQNVPRDLFYFLNVAILEQNVHLAKMYPVRYKKNREPSSLTQTKPPRPPTRQPARTNSTTTDWKPCCTMCPLCRVTVGVFGSYGS